MNSESVIQPVDPAQLLTRLSSWIADNLGLHFPAERWADLERNISVAAQEQNFASNEAYITHLLANPVNRARVETLASYLTVGETYFFREPNSFSALEHTVFPALINARRNNKRLRIWCAGCCSGEEPYSVAILLDKLIPDYQDWHNTILATDITPRYLKKAEDGIYGEWSFRGTPEWLRDRYFSKSGHNLYQISPTIKRRVTFSYLNLVDDNYPSFLNNTNGMDIIFCRNVLMYFTEEHAKKVIDKLHKSLIEGGWLITGSTETSIQLFDAFVPISFPGALLYQKREQQHHNTVSHSAGTITDDLEQTLHPLSEPIPSDKAETISNEPTECSRKARACADQGQLEQAADWFQAAIDMDKLNPAYRYLLATVQIELGQGENAAKSLQNAIYLDHDFVLAHFALANLHLTQGRISQAAKYFTNVRTLLQALPDEHILPESEGISAGRLREIASALQSTLSRQPRPHQEKSL